MILNLIFNAIPLEQFVALANDHQDEQKELSPGIIGIMKATLDVMTNEGYKYTPNILKWILKISKLHRFQVEDKYDLSPKEIYQLLDHLLEESKSNKIFVTISSMRLLNDNYSYAPQTSSHYDD